MSSVSGGRYTGRPVPRLYATVLSSKLASTKLVSTLCLSEFVVSGVCIATLVGHHSVVDVNEIPAKIFYAQVEIVYQLNK